MALIVPPLKPGLQAVDSRRGHHHEYGGADDDHHVHNLSISRAIRERSRNSLRFGLSLRRGRDAGAESANIRPIEAANRRLMCRGRAGTAAAVLKSTSCSVISTSVNDAATEGAAEGSGKASAVLADAVREYDISVVSFAVRVVDRSDRPLPQETYGRQAPEHTSSALPVFAPHRRELGASP
jgi:hypothetical protein